MKFFVKNDKHDFFFKLKQIYKTKRSFKKKKKKKKIIKRDWRKLTVHLKKKKKKKDFLRNLKNFSKNKNLDILN